MASKHGKPYDDPYESEEQFLDDVAAIQAIDAMTQGSADVNREALAAYLRDSELSHWLLNYLHETHPGILRDMLAARKEEILRREARRKDEQAVTQLLAPGAQDDSLHDAYAEAIRESEARTEGRQP